MLAEPKEYLSGCCVAGTWVHGPVREEAGLASSLPLLSFSISFFCPVGVFTLNSLLLPSTAHVILTPWLTFKAFCDVTHSPVSRSCPIAPFLACPTCQPDWYLPRHFLPLPVVTWPPARMSSPSLLSCPDLVLVCDSASAPGLLLFGKQ